MSYAGSAARPNRPTPSPASTDGDWQQLAVFGAGLALGIALGAGAALLAAPASGLETRHAIAKRARGLRRRTVKGSQDAWEGLRAEIQGATRALQRRKMRRELEREMAAENW